MTFSAPLLIERTRDGEELPAGAVRWLVDGFVAGRVSPEQMSAWCMAVVFRGLSDGAIDDLCTAMLESGERLDLSSLGRRVVDKHSTGGVGDKTTIALAPLVAACGVPVAKMSGRGLAHTGGTLDKLEAIPGFRVGLDVPELIAQVQRIGVAVAAQSDRLAPADGLLYALRDVTGTVPAPALIASSVMSKKLAAGADAILLDVKVGDGAFVRTVDQGRALALLMRGLGERAGVPTICELTRMDEPLGLAVGNAVETAEAFDLLRGEAPDDLLELVLTSTARLLAMSDLGVDEQEGRRRATAAIESGAAVEVAERWVEAQGGDARVVADPWAVLERAGESADVPAPRSGSISTCGALAIGRAAMGLGAGRERKSDPVDHAVGIVLVRKVGDRVEQGAPLARVHGRSRAAVARALDEVAAAYVIADGPIERPALLIETVG
ncbi:MAG: thymidine phosphorylase [Gaiellales bacterium]